MSRTKKAKEPKEPKAAKEAPPKVTGVHADNVKAEADSVRCGTCHRVSADCICPVKAA